MATDTKESKESKHLSEEEQSQIEKEKMELNEAVQEAVKQGKVKSLEDKRNKLIFRILMIIIIILLLLLLRQCSADRAVLNPDYPPKDLEANATAIDGDDKNKLEHEEGGGAVSLHFTDEATIDLSDNKLYLSFANPGRSTQDMLLQVTIQDEIIVESGRIVPGYEVASLELEAGAGRKLKEGIYDGMFVITYYDPDNHERAMVNTDAPVQIIVQR